MGKKIIYILFSLAVISTGVFGFQKLHYWERSARIFSYNSMDQRFERRGDRSGREFRGRPEGDFRERPEGEFWQRPEGEFRQRPEGEFRQGSDDRASFGPGDRGRDGHGRGDFRRGPHIRLRNVWWFLAVFSGFTALTVSLDRGWLHIRRKARNSSR